MGEFLARFAGVRSSLRRAPGALRRVNRSTIAGLTLILLIGVLLGAVLHVESERRRVLALAAFRTQSDRETRTALRPIEQLFEHVYEDLRTLAALPSVRAVDRQGVSLVGDSRETFQQIYNNLADAVAISEVYVIPGDFDPERIDPVTGRPEEPIVMFDQLIVDAAMRVDEDERDSLAEGAFEEIEIHEYREFAQQAKWMRQQYPRRESIEGLDVPMIGSRSLITCDNTYFMRSGRDADRMGILLSVPFYGPDGAFKGLVSAIILDRAISEALPDRGAVLHNRAYRYVLESDTTQVKASREHFEAGRPDPSLLFSANYDLDVPESRGTWAVWVGRPNSDFTSSAQARAARTFELAGLAILSTLTLLASAMWLQFRRQKQAVEVHARDLEVKVAERTEEISRLALTDFLTDLPNRAKMRMHLARLSARVARKPYAVLCVDLDRLKTINDALGHAAGDAYLRNAAARMQRTIGSRGTVARWGGDEFVITVEGRDLADRAERIAGEVLNDLVEEMMVEGHKVVPGCSIGVAVAPLDGESSEDLLNRADRALYRAKAEGRGRVVRYDPALDETHKHRRELEDDLRIALERRQFVVHYQPVVDARTGGLVGFEALARWWHPRRGLILPSEFIPVAEDSGLIVDIGEIVLEEACRAASTWRAPLRVAVNLSPVQVAQDSLPTRIASVLQSTGLDAERLELELTENVLLAATAESLDRIRRIRQFGVGFALDDFGTGYASLGYLQNFSFDRIKIDRSFIADLGTRPTCVAIVRAVTQLAGSLGMRTTAEGVETLQQAEFLARNGVSELQGYLLGRPEAAPAAFERAHSRRRGPGARGSAPAHPATEHLSGAVGRPGGH